MKTRCLWAPYKGVNGVCCIEVETEPSKRGHLKITNVPEQDNCYADDLRKFLNFNNLTFDKTTGKCVNYQSDKVRLLLPIE